MQESNHPSTGAVVTVYWSKQGNWEKRKQLFGARVSSSWDAKRLHRDTWLLGKKITHNKIKELFAELPLAAADRAVVVFPHGKSTTGASQMSVHTYNCE